jgi:hypothetical protein
MDYMNRETARRAKQIVDRMPGDGKRSLSVNEIAGVMSVEPATVQTWLGGTVDHLDFARMGAGDHNIRVHPDELVRFVTRRLGTKDSVDL